MKSALQSNHLSIQPEKQHSSQSTQAEILVHCLYCNNSTSPHVLRSKHFGQEHPCWFIERVVMPGVCLEFDASLEGVIEVYTGEIIFSVLSDTIPVKALCVEV
jgi:Domain of unknown function (DUF1830)